MSLPTSSDDKPTYPQDWDSIELRDVFSLTSGKTRPADSEKDKSIKNRYPIYGGNGILGYSDRYLVDFPTVVIGRVGEYCGSVHGVWEKCWVSDNALYAKAFLTDNISLDYLKASLEVLDLNRFKKKSGQPLITQSIVLGQSIPLPPLSEQKSIACILSAVQDARKKTEAVIEAAKKLKKSLMKYLFTYGPVTVGEAKNVRLKETEIGMIPEKWPVVELAHVFKVTSGKSRPKEIADLKSESFKFPVYGGNGIMGYSRENLIEEDTVVL